MGLYVGFEPIRVRLIGKVQFTENEEDENRMHISLAKRLINEAEGQVELDLSPRFMAPFQTISGAPYSSLPVRPTQEILRTLCELQSVIRILETDFGAGTPVDGDKYAEKLRARYKELTTERLLKRLDETYRQWFYPPLDGLRLAFHNAAADDGFAGTAINLSSGEGGFPAEQMNQPSATVWNVCWADIDGGAK